MSSAHPKSPELVPDAEVVEPRPKRRTFTAAYKARILEVCDASEEPGAIGAILRREGLFSSHVVDWRRRRAEGGVNGLSAKKTGRPRKSDAEKAAVKEAQRLARRNAALEEGLRKARIIIEAQKSCRKHWMRWVGSRATDDHRPGDRPERHKARAWTSRCFTSTSWR